MPCHLAAASFRPLKLQEYAKTFARFRYFPSVAEKPSLQVSTTFYVVEVLIWDHFVRFSIRMTLTRTSLCGSRPRRKLVLSSSIVRVSYVEKLLESRSFSRAPSPVFFLRGESFTNGEQGKHKATPQRMRNTFTNARLRKSQNKLPARRSPSNSSYSFAVRNFSTDTTTAEREPRTKQQHTSKRFSVRPAVNYTNAYWLAPPLIYCKVSFVAGT